MKIKILFLLLLVFNFAGATSAAQFLDNGVSARSEGLARAFTAVADDLDAFYFNPAGYGRQTESRTNTLFTKNRNIEDVLYAGYGQRLFGGYAALNFYSSGIEDIPRNTMEPNEYGDLRPTETGEKFSSSTRAFILSYGRSLGKIFGTATDLSWGVNIKHLQETLYENAAFGTGLDAGLLFQSGDVSFGWSVINLVEPQMAWNTDSGAVDVVERRQRFGLAYTLFDVLLVSGELNIGVENTLVGIGAEYMPVQYFALRAGTFTDHYVMGLGFNYAGLNLNYAYLVPADSLVEPTQKISLGYTF